MLFNNNGYREIAKSAPGALSLRGVDGRDKPGHDAAGATGTCACLSLAGESWREGTRKAALAALAFFAAAAAAAAQQPARDQGDWPCRQIRVLNLSPGAIWSGPPLEGLAQNWRDDAGLNELALRLAARRTPLEAAEKLIGEFAQRAGAARKERLTALFAVVYEKLDFERRDVVLGLDRYGRAQKETAERLRQQAQKLREAQDAKTGAEQLKDLSEKLQWDMRLFEERRQAATFVCETPALIEQRLGALARAIVAAIES